MTPTAPVASRSRRSADGSRRRGLNDAALASLDLVRRYGDNWERPLSYSRAGRELARLGFRDDVLDAARMDAYPVLPQFHERRVTLAPSGQAQPQVAPQPSASSAASAPAVMTADSRRRLGALTALVLGVFVGLTLLPDSAHGPGRRMDRARASGTRSASGASASRLLGIGLALAGFERLGRLDMKRAALLIGRPEPARALL